MRYASTSGLINVSYIAVPRSTALRLSSSPPPLAPPLPLWGGSSNLYRSDDEAILVAMTTYIGQPTDQYRFTPPPSARRILPSQSSPAVLPAERANFDSELPHIPPKEIAYSDDNDSLQRDRQDQECTGR